jgi:predicted TIM-barrel fold metal-dependent hydrolase
MRRLLTAHPAEFLLFGTDSPWQDQAACLRKLEQLNLNELLLKKILRTNGMKLLP